MLFNTREMLKKYDLKLIKALGQNFLNDEEVIKNIAISADINEDDYVIEVGSGLGILTQELAKKAKKVTTIEIDKRLISILTENFKEYPNVELINEDAMKIDIEELIRKNKTDDIKSVKVVANLPYYITTPLIMKFLESGLAIDLYVFMVQKEVADRMVSKPVGKQYGALSVSVQYYTEPKIAFNVPPHVFIPQPEVDSTVIRLDVHKKPMVELKDIPLFFKIVKASFGQRRKTLVNALFNSGNFNLSKDIFKEILEGMGLNENVRGETFDVTKFARLANEIYDRK